MRSVIAGTPARSFTETARRVQLMGAAVAAVNELGYHRASLAEIARRAEVAKSAILYYFPSKEALLLGVVEDAFAALGVTVLDGVRGADPGSPLARLRAYAAAYIAHVDSHRAVIAAAVEVVVSHRTAEGRPLYLVEDEADTQLLRQILGEGMAVGAFVPMPITTAVSLVESALDRGITIVQRDPTADLSDFAAHAVPFIERGLGVEAGE